MAYSHAESYQTTAASTRQNSLDFRVAIDNLAGLSQTGKWAVISMSSSTPSQAVAKHKQYLFPAVSMYYQEPIALSRGEGAWVWDDQGNKYLDAFGKTRCLNRRMH